MRNRTFFLAAAGLLLSGSAALAQQTPAPAQVMPEVGTMAPDFAIRGVTRHGVLQDPAKLSDYRGQTVVLAFFPAARSRG